MQIKAPPVDETPPASIQPNERGVNATIAGYISKTMVGSVNVFDKLCTYLLMALSLVKIPNIRRILPVVETKGISRNNIAKMSDTERTLSKSSDTERTASKNSDILNDNSLILMQPESSDTERTFSKNDDTL